MRHDGPLYRALNPRWAADPLSGAGAALHGGRFNARGTPALYTSLRPETALREANQVGSLQPTLMVEYRGRVEGIVDGRDPAALDPYGLAPEHLATADWREAMLARGEAPTQALAAALIADGCAGLLVPSFARGATARDLNLVLWRWDGLTVVDDEQRLDVSERGPAGSARPRPGQMVTTSSGGKPLKQTDE